jgi:hypothetical protein
MASASAVEDQPAGALAGDRKRREIPRQSTATALHLATAVRRLLILTVLAACSGNVSGMTGDDGDSSTDPDASVDPVDPDSIAR